MSLRENTDNGWRQENILLSKENTGNIQNIYLAFPNELRTIGQLKSCACSTEETSLQDITEYLENLMYFFDIVKNHVSNENMELKKLTTQ